MMKEEREKTETEEQASKYEHIPTVPNIEDVRLEPSH